MNTINPSAGVLASATVIADLDTTTNTAATTVAAAATVVADSSDTTTNTAATAVTVVTDSDTTTNTAATTVAAATTVVADSSDTTTNTAATTVAAAVGDSDVSAHAAATTTVTTTTNTTVAAAAAAAAATDVNSADTNAAATSTTAGFVVPNVPPLEGSGLPPAIAAATVGVVVEGYHVEGIEDDAPPHIKRHAIAFYNKLIPLFLKAPPTWHLIDRAKYCKITTALKHVHDGVSLSSLRTEYPNIHYWNKNFAVIQNNDGASDILVARPKDAIDMLLVPTEELKRMACVENVFAKLRVAHVALITSRVGLCMHDWERW